jgi:hypothetical protein
MAYRSTFASLLFMPFLLQAGAGLVLELLCDDEGCSANLYGAYSTHYITGKLSINYETSFPDNFAIKFEPNEFINQEDLAKAIALASITDGSFNLGKHYLKKRYYQDKELEEYLIASYLQKHKKNLQLLKESYNG